jgi:hypothetical protein
MLPPEWGGNGKVDEDVAFDRGSAEKFPKVGRALEMSTGKTRKLPRRRHGAGVFGRSW